MTEDFNVGSSTFDQLVQLMESAKSTDTTSVAIVNHLEQMASSFVKNCDLLNTAISQAIEANDEQIAEDERSVNELEQIMDCIAQRIIRIDQKLLQLEQTISDQDDGDDEMTSQGSVRKRSTRKRKKKEY